MLRLLFLSVFALLLLTGCGDDLSGQPSGEKFVTDTPGEEPIDDVFEGSLGKKDTDMTGTSQPAGKSILNEDESQAVFDSYFFGNSTESVSLPITKSLRLPSIKNPEEFQDLIKDKSPDSPTLDEPDLLPKSKKPPWINRGDGDSIGIVPGHVKSNSANDVDLTLRGRLFYNDLRLVGHFDERHDLNGNPGLGISSLISGVSRNCYKEVGCDVNLLEHENFLAARGVVAEFWEVDHDYDRKDREHCNDLEYLGKSTVGRYGNYSLNLTELTDDCPDGNSAAEIAISFRLRFCNTTLYCFDLVRKNASGQKLYSKYHRDAKPGNTMLVNLGETHDLADEKFGGSLDDSNGKEFAIAANRYASMVDTARVLHEEEEIPFRFNRYGGLVVYICPKSYADSLKEKKRDKECFNGRAYGSSVIGTREPSVWIWGGLIAHEYGHTVDARTGDQTNCRAWGLTDCIYGRQAPDLMEGGVLDDEDNEYYEDKNGDGLYENTGKEWEEGWTRSSWSSTSYEYPFVALSEGWGSFVSRAVFGSCDEIEENTPKRGGAVQPDYDDTVHDHRENNVVTRHRHRTDSEHTGNGYVRNVTKTLCDWYDDHRSQDDDAEMLDINGVDRFPGYGDRFQASLWSMWHNLDQSTPGKKGKDICDYARYYIEDRKAPERVGQSDHDFYKERIVNLLYNNGLKCGHEAPEPRTGSESGRPDKNGTICHASPTGRRECS